jgi:WD40 repeat protein
MSSMKQYSYLNLSKTILLFSALFLLFTDDACQNRVLEDLELVTSEVYGATVWSVAWCEGCDYLAIGGERGGGLQIRVYSFDKTSSTLNLVTSAAHGNIVKSVAWCNGCDYLAIGGTTGTGG